MQGAKPETTRQYAEAAKARLRELQRQAQSVLAEHPEIGSSESLPAAAAAEPYNCPARVNFTGIAIWESVQVCCNQPVEIMTTAHIWGVTTAIGGVSWGECAFSVPPPNLPGLGKLTMQVAIASVAVEISWWQGSNLIGTFVGAGLGIGLAQLGGSCSFENGSC